MMPLFIYDSTLLNEMSEDIKRAGKCQSMITQGVNNERIRHTVRILTHHKQLVIPDLVSQCTEPVERIKAIARQMPGMNVTPLTAYVAGQQKLRAVA